MQNNINNQNLSYSDKGGLVVTVSTAGQTKPIQGAHVIISRREGKNEIILRSLITDGNGKTVKIELPAPPEANSTSPSNKLGYSIYNIRVDYPGYYTIENIDVPIFPGIIAVQPVNMIPLPLDTYQGKAKIFTETEPEDLIEEESGERR